MAPPCPPPPHGWPIVLRRSDVELGYDLGDLELTGAAVAVTLFRLGPNRAVLVVAAGDVAAVEPRLRPQLGESLCVVPSRWTKAQLDTVGDYLHYQWELWRLYGLGLHNTDDGQPHMAARLVRVLPEIAAWAATLPNDVLLLEPWLMPLRADAAGAAGERETTSMVDRVTCRRLFSHVLVVFLGDEALRRLPAMRCGYHQPGS